MEVNTVNNYQGIGNFGVGSAVVVDNKNKNQHQINPEIELNQKRSNVATTLKPIIYDISNLTQIKQDFQKQYDVLNKIKESVNKNENTDISKFVEQFDAIQDSIKDKLQKINESRDYFDGLYGAKRLSPDEIIKQVQKRMEKIKEAISVTDKKVQDLQEEANKKINEEIFKSKEQTPIKQYNFGKESNDFSNNNLNNISGNIVFAQGNVNTTQIHKEVLY